MKNYTKLALLCLIALPTMTSAAQKPLGIPSEPKAAYFVLEKSITGNEATIVTKRVGSSGTSYSRRLYNCVDKTVKYIGSGDSIDAMNASAPDPKMSPIFERSIAYYVGIEACN
jgi:hypothetical protein